MNHLCNNTGNGTGGNGACPNNRDDGQTQASITEIMRITSIVSYVLILVLSSLGNSTIIATVIRNKSMQNKANVLIINMAVSDLLATLFALPRMLDVYITKSKVWKVPEVVAEGACKFSPFMREVSCAVSIFSMVAIAVDRFYAIVVPMHRKPRLLELKFLIPSTWVTALVTNALYLYAFQMKKENELLQCKNVLTLQQDRIFDTFRFVVFIAVPLQILVYLYIIIAIKMGRQAIPGATGQSFASNRRHQNKKIVILAVTIVAFFFISWTPYYVLLLMFIYNAWQVYRPSPNAMIVIFILQRVFTILTYASFAINPIICIVFSSNFRRHITRTFCRSHLPKTRTFTQRTTATNRTTSRPLSLHNLDISLGQVTGIENPTHEDDIT
ncbi:QRFP-like peptide receptor [Actinia tenebrosa]|uniref:QRFP-like peptide receptor n=1 Tax=Actinia tenebrosa TaxID=6105 RepID=A0A6P8H056_ACTTE|nr:QRFP-like peptide receptor [Actinia tenebrosa]XP_031548766.1 QRFP-like peptide receptor [Actinia tenebrosa]